MRDVAEKRAEKSASAQSISRTAMSGAHRPLMLRCEPSEIGRLREHPGHDLSPRMHAGVGSTGSGQLDRGPHDGLDGPTEFAHDGSYAVALGEAVEVGAVVGECQPGIAP